MKYSTGNIGRVFVAKIEDGDDLLAELKSIASLENIESGVVYVIGALKKGAMVVGPETCKLPPVPVWRSFEDCREIVGLGTLFKDTGGQPQLHLHGALGRDDITLTGCLRVESEVYLVAEVVILELVGTGACRELDPLSGLKLLSFVGK